MNVKSETERIHSDKLDSGLQTNRTRTGPGTLVLSETVNFRWTNRERNLEKVYKNEKNVLLPLFTVEFIVVEVEVLEANEQREADTGQQHRPNNPWVAKISVLGKIPAEEIG